MPVGTTTAQFLAMHGVYVAWASSDLGSFTPASAPLAALTTTASSFTTSTASRKSSPARHTNVSTATSTRTHSSPAATTMAATPTSTGSSNPLSTGAQAGIGVGVSVAGLALIASALLFSLRRRRRSRPLPADYAPYDIMTSAPSPQNPMVHHNRNISALSRGVGNNPSLMRSELEGSSSTPSGGMERL